MGERGRKGAAKSSSKNYQKGRLTDDQVKELGDFSLESECFSHGGRGVGSKVRVRRRGKRDEKWVR